MSEETQIAIRTHITDDGSPCYVSLGTLNLTAQDAINLGLEVTNAGRRALILNAVKLLKPNSTEFLQKLLNNLGGIR